MKKDELLTLAIEFLNACLHFSIFTCRERKSATIWQEYRTQRWTEFSSLEGNEHAGFWLLKFNFFEKAMKICAIFLMVLTFTKEMSKP